MAVIYSQHYRGVLYEVRTAGHSRRLYTNGAFHTQYNPRHLFTGAVWDLLSLPVLCQQNRPRSLLVLGVAGGAVIHQLQTLCDAPEITGIELDAKHLQLARSHFDLKYPNLNLIRADARDWLGECDTRFDCIIDDIFLHGTSDPERTVAPDRDWFRLLTDRLTEDGLLIQNHIDRQSAKKAARFMTPGTILGLETDQYVNLVLAWYRHGNSAKALKRQMEQRLEALPRQETSRLRARAFRFSAWSRADPGADAESQPPADTFHTNPVPNRHARMTVLWWLLQRRRGKAMEKLTEGYGLVEGPVWLPGQGLIFSDVSHGGAYLINQQGRVETIFAHRRGMGGMARHEAGGLVVSGRNISWKSIPEGETKTLFEPDASGDMIGFNDITTDSAGRIYVGSLGSDPLNDSEQTHAGSLYMIDLDGSTHEVATDILLTNGLGFSPDGKRLYHSDSSRNQVNCYAVKDHGTLGAKQVFTTTQSGAPDGLAVSEDGCVWVALAGGGGVAVFNPDGSFERLLEIPEPMCTSVCFGGDDLKDLYIVSGSGGMNSDRAGAVYVERVQVAGLPVAPARVTLP